MCAENTAARRIMSVTQEGAGVLTAAAEEPLDPWLLGLFSLSGVQAASRTLLEFVEAEVPRRSPFTPPKAVSLELSGDEGAKLDDVLAEVCDTFVRHAVDTRHPLSMAHMVPPPLGISVLADLLIGATNQCAFIYEEAPLAATLERQVVDWLCARVGYGAGAGGMLTSGGTMSNLLAVHLARERALQEGRDLTALRIVASDQVHVSLDKAASLAGLGHDAIVRVPTDVTGRLRDGAVCRLADELASKDLHPFLFICTAGTANAGVVEPLPEFLASARSHGAWCHMDAALGGMLTLTDPVATSDWYQADSVSWDPHKTLYASYAVGSLLLRNDHESDRLRFHAEYALKRDSDQDAGDRRLEGSRRLEALKLWMCIRHLGTAGYTQILRRARERTTSFAERIHKAPGLELVTEPDTTVVCFRLVQPGLSQRDVDLLHERVQQALFHSGRLLLSTTRVGGSTVLRAVLLNPLVGLEDLDEALQHVTQETARQAALL
ncbi:aspartate aminotransferase family protein [Streptomyces axinellae]|uniref:Aspartate aminotransferase family protein n=2 Tax=Streptomyces axinellae TaxID=552788 RepID=A0ABN3PUD3_9ACTN